ncbi:unnamed protein product [Auanema sp. JU1783]|nr:unnamed protein product [Auanema sp. JU1783]
MSEEEVTISPSQLGTKEYWDGRYQMELENFRDCGDEGEIWFGQSAENRICKYLKATAPCDSKILDLGCGNGSVLRSLRSKGFKFLIGVDYSPAAIELSNSISVQDAEENDFETKIDFQVLDILNDQQVQNLASKFDYVLDKGTWDAMSLSDDRESRMKAYKKTVVLSLTKGGALLLFSCNFTKDELIDMFSGEELDYESEIPATHVISYGGKKGVTSTGIVFRMK